MRGGFYLIFVSLYVFSGCTTISRSRPVTSRETPARSKVKIESEEITVRGLRPPIGTQDVHPAYSVVLEDFRQALEQQQPAVAISIIEKGLKDPSLVVHHPSLRQRALDIIEGIGDKQSLYSIAEDADSPDIRAHAYFAAAGLELEEHRFNQASDSYAKALSLAPNSDLAARAERTLSELQELGRVENKTIGLILPLTGKQAEVAKRTLRGIQVGLGLFDEPGSGLRLAVVDSEGNSDVASRQLTRLIREDHPVAVVGDLLSKTSSVVARKCNELGVPNISLSQKISGTDPSPYVFQNALTASLQIHALVDHAMNQLGLKNFAILYPNDPYGVEYANIFWDEVLARGGTIRGAQSYSDKETDFRSSIERLVGTFYFENRADEFAFRKKNQPKEAASSVLPPILDFDAIFIPDGTKTLGQISAMLTYNDVRDVWLLGTNLWNNPDLEKRTGHFADKVLFMDHFAFNDPEFSKSLFASRFRNIYGVEPGMFELQGYDIGLMLRQLIAQGYDSRDSLSRALSQLKGFPGAFGPISTNPENEIQRQIQALTLKSISPAKKN